MKFPKCFLSALFFAAISAHASPAHRFEELSQNQQKTVKDTYRDLLSAQKKDFAKMSADAQAILALLDDYNDTKAYANIAQRGLEQEKLEKDPETQKRKDRALRDLAALEIKGQRLLAKAKSDPDARAELYKIMKEISSLDPANTYPAEWRKKLHEE